MQQSTKQSIRKANLHQGYSQTKIQPFVETPSSERGKAPLDGQGTLNCIELFSIFTADVIRQDRMFIR